MSSAYVITKGEYDEYSIVAVCLTKAEADEMCKLLNANPSNGVHDVEEYLLGEPAYGNKVRGFRGAYQLSKGLTATAEDLDVVEAYYDAYDEGSSEVFRQTQMVAFGNTREKCVQVLLDAIARKAAVDAIRKAQGKDS